jgi:integrase
MPITDTKARNAKPREKLYRIADGGGLCLEVRPSGRKTWRLRYRLEGKPNMFTIGDYPGVGLGEARARRDWGKEVILKGLHPRDEVERGKRERNLENLNTFEKVAEEWYDKRSPGWTDYYANQVRKTLDSDVLPTFGKTPIREVGAPQILDLLRKIEGRGAPTVAVLTRQWLSAIFRYGIVTLRTDADPAEYVKGAVTRPEVKNAVALTDQQIKQLLGQLAVFGGYRMTQVAIELLLLTMVRTIELRRARWEDFDFEGAMWRIPKEDMKRQRQHLVPLSRQVIGLLKELKEYTGGSTILVPGMKDPRKPIHLTTINQALGRMGFGGGKFSAHGFRATASTHMNEHGWHPDAIERQLAHAPDDRTRGAYNHAQYLDTRREMMQWWADYVDGLRST